jgi:MoaA/NifB/PqqE/SkfB family radical SAM enzyme
LQQLTVDEKGFIAPCVFLPGERSINDGDLLENWQNMAVKYREVFKSGKKFQVCRSCSCHFAENFRSSIIAYPIVNRSQLLWLLSYYSKRLLLGEGRKV